MMENFSASITKAEQMTGGNVNILKTFETPTKAKQFLTATPDAETSASLSIIAPATSTAKKSLTSVGSYNASVKVQNTSNDPTKRIFTCTMCTFTTDRLNLLMMHIKAHSLEIQSRVNGKLYICRIPNY